LIGEVYGDPGLVAATPDVDDEFLTRCSSAITSIGITKEMDWLE
jgi:hypothetical protein